MNNIYEEIAAERERQVTEWCCPIIYEHEVLEAFTETDPVKQREKMIQVCVLGVQIIEELDRKIKEGRGV